MNHAHPMITPIAAIPPQKISELYDIDAARVYKIIWDNTLSHIKKPVEINEHLYVFSSSIGDFFIKFIDKISPEWIEEYCEQMDIKKKEFNILDFNIENNFECLSNCNYNVVSRKENNISTRLDSLILWLNDMKVASPNKISNIFEDLEKKEFIKFDHEEVYLTEQGKNQIATSEKKLKKQINGETNIFWKILSDDYVNGNITYKEFSQKTCALLGIQADPLIDQIESIVTEGHCSADAYKLLENPTTYEQNSPKYPTSINPEVSLPSDSPLRAKKIEIEHILGNKDATKWRFLPHAKKSAIRTGLLISTENEQDQKNIMDAIKFDIRFKWLVGLEIEASVPQSEYSIKAYNEWML